MSNDRKMYSDEEIGGLIRGIPEMTPPPWLASRIMETLADKRSGVWARFKGWLTTPQSFTFSPARMVFASLLIVAVVGVAGMLGGRLSEVGSGQPDGLVPVSFVFKDPAMGLKSVAVVGSFNEWNAEENQMKYVPEIGMWVFRTRLPAGDYEYVFLVDGETVVQDPQSVLSKDDGFGNRNSVILVKGDHEYLL